MSDIDKMRSEISISEFVGRFVKLKPIGHGKFSGLCPFHNEKTPSFSVNNEKGLYYCFGCSEGGDIFTFIQKYKNIEFSDAITEIAQMYNMQIDVKSGFVDNSTEYDLLERVAELFHKHLIANSAAKHALFYLKTDRGLTDETISKFQIGHCPHDNDFLISHFADKVDVMLKLGLIGKSASGSGMYSRFRDRVIFPIRDEKSNVVGFGGRILDSGASAAKYLNSPESEIFKKHEILYNLNNAKSSKNDLIIVEGYMDVVSLAQHGIDSAIAQMGTAFAENNMKKIWKHTKVPLFCLDSDTAGQKATSRIVQDIIPLLRPQCSAKFVTLSTKDPDEYISKYGVDAFRTEVTKSIPMYEKIWRDASFDVDFKNPDQLADLEVKIAAIAEQIKVPEIAKTYKQYFKDQIYKSKFVQSRPKWTRGQNAPAPKTKASTLEIHKISDSGAGANLEQIEGILTLFIVHNPKILETQEYQESDIIFANKDMQKIILDVENGIEIPKIILDGLHRLYGEYVKKYEEETEMITQYKKIVTKKIVDAIKGEITKALIARDFAKVGLLKSELIKVSGGILNSEED